MWPFLRWALGYTPRVHGQPAFVVFDPEVARALAEPTGAVDASERASTCEKCSRVLEACVITTWDPTRKQQELWEQIPIAVDGWVCRQCGEIRYPRPLSVDGSVQYGKEGAKHARAGRYEIAEWWFRRLAWTWPGYAAAYLDLATALNAHSQQVSQDGERTRLLNQARQAYEQAVVTAEGRPDVKSDPRILAAALLGLAEVAIAQRAIERARRAVVSCLAIADLSAEGRSRAEQLLRHIDEALYVFADASAIISPYMVLEGRPLKPIETPRERSRVVQAVEELERHYASFPSHWQSLFVVAMGRGALGESDRALQHWRTGAERHTDAPSILKEASRQFLLRGLNDEALAACRAATAAAPDEAALWCNRAVSELLTGDLDEARVCLTESLRLDPSDGVAKNLERHLASITPDRLPRSLAELEGRKP